MTKVEERPGRGPSWGKMLPDEVDPFFEDGWTGPEAVRSVLDIYRDYFPQQREGITPLGVLVKPPHTRKQRLGVIEQEEVIRSIQRFNVELVGVNEQGDIVTVPVNDGYDAQALVREGKHIGDLGQIYSEGAREATIETHHRASRPETWALWLFE